MGCHQAEAVFLSFTVDRAVAEGVLTLQTAVKVAQFSLLRCEGFEVRLCFTIVWKAAFLWEPPEARLLSISSFDLSTPSLHREIAVISHAVIHCDKENHNYPGCKLHRMLMQLLLPRLLGTVSAALQK